MRVAIVLVATIVIDINPLNYKDEEGNIPSLEDAVQLEKETIHDNPTEFLEHEEVSIDVHIQEIHD